MLWVGYTLKQAETEPKLSSNGSRMALLRPAEPIQVATGGQEMASTCISGVTVSNDWSPLDAR